MLPLEPGETIIKEVHRSIFGLLVPAIISIFLIIGGFGAFFLASRIVTDPVIGQASLFLDIAGVVLLILGILYFLFQFILFRRNRLVLTNLHIIDFNAFSLFTQDIQRLALDRDFSVQGWNTDIFSMLFGYGRLQVQTGDGLTKLTFDYMPNVQSLVTAIEDARQAPKVKL